jgi:hypothetical protein
MDKNIYETFIEGCVVGSIFWIYFSIDVTNFILILLLIITAKFVLTTFIKHCTEYKILFYHRILLHSINFFIYILTFISLLLHNTNIITWLGGLSVPSLICFIVWFFMGLILLSYQYYLMYINELCETNKGSITIEDLKNALGNNQTKPLMENVIVVSETE